MIPHPSTQRRPDIKAALRQLEELAEQELAEIARLAAEAHHYAIQLSEVESHNIPFTFLQLKLNANFLSRAVDSHADLMRKIGDMKKLWGDV